MSRVKEAVRVGAAWTLLHYNAAIHNRERFSAGEFDEWAATYDSDVVAQDRFPFASYEAVLETIVHLAEPTSGLTVLDLGTGTGNLAMRFAGTGCQLWCTDFSEKMLGVARRKLRTAHFVQADVAAEWPAELPAKFDRIVSAYVFHHFPLDQKAGLVRALANDHLAVDGRLIIGDLSFDDGGAMAKFAVSVGSLWEDEPYWIADESLAALTADGLRVSYNRVSDCAGVYCIEGSDGIRTQD